MKNSRLTTPNSQLTTKTAIILTLTIACLLLPQAAQAATYYCDPVNGNTITGDGSAEHPWGTLESAVMAGKFKYPTWVVKSGDTVKLKAGFHGAPAFKNSEGGVKNQYTDYVTIEPNGMDVVELSRVTFYDSAYYRLKGLQISPSLATPSLVTEHSQTEKGSNAPKIVYMYGSHHITVENSNIFTTMDVSGWDPNDWLYLAWTGAYYNYSNTGIFRNNTIRNVMDGIDAGSNSLVEGNLVDGFTGDGFHIGGPNSIIQDNRALNIYKHEDNYDPTNLYPHSDGIQLYGSGDVGLNVTIRRNYINGRTDPNRDINSVGGLQGIFLEADMTDSLIENNVIMALNDAWGITMWRAINTKILNNTVLRPYGIGYWPNIAIEKAGSSNAIIQNNIADEFWTSDPGITSSNNFRISDYDPAVEFVDYAHGNVRLTAGSHFVDAGSSADAPNEDLERNPRPQGQGYDVGAYEYGASGAVSGDINGDGSVDALDLQLLINMILSGGYDSKADLNKDSSVDAVDLQALVNIILG